MEVSTARYACRVDGWNWAYELFPDKLLAIGIKGEEHQHFEIELKHCGGTPDRGVTTILVWNHAGFWITYLTILGVTAFLLGSIMAVTTVFDIRLPGNHKGSELMAFTVALVFLESMSLPLLSRLLQKRRLQRYVIFKRVSDGGPLLTLNSALDTDDTFEDFIAEVIAAIRNQRKIDPPSPYSIKKMTFAWRREGSS